MLGGGVGIVLGGNVIFWGNGVLVGLNEGFMVGIIIGLIVGSVGCIEGWFDGV